MDRVVARNSLMLALRMVLTTIVGLYTSRVVLEALGVDSYGAYAVVGGIVGILAFLNMSMTAATSRFLTYELGRGHPERLSHIFSAALVAHLLVALLLLAAAESAGLWYLARYVNLPAGLEGQAQWVYQLSVATALVSVLQVPYNALLIARERMDIFAWVEMAATALKLGVAWILTVYTGSRLVLYAALLLAVALAAAAAYVAYDVRHYPEARPHLRSVRRTTLIPILRYCATDLYGLMCVTSKTQGIVLMVNYFYGVACNAALSVASTINSAVLRLTSTVSQAFRPRVIKAYAAGDLPGMLSALRQSLQFTMLASAALLLPCCVAAPQLLGVWLGDVPAHAVVFTRVILLLSLVTSVNDILNTAIHATGRIRALSYGNGTLFLVVLPAAYVGYRLGMPAWGAYAVEGVITVLILGNALRITRALIPGLRVGSVARAVLLCWLVEAMVMAILLAVAAVVHTWPALLQILTLGTLSVLLTAGAAWSIILDDDARRLCLHALRRRLRR